jgi:dihydrolipoamide dehydrogenase
MKTGARRALRTLGGVCLNVGCIPSKALLHIAAVMDETKTWPSTGFAFGAPKIDLDALRGWKNKVVGKLTGGLAGHGEGAQGRGRSRRRPVLDPHHVEVESTEGPGRRRQARRRSCASSTAIIAAGSQSVWLPFVPTIPHLRLDRRLELAKVPSGCSSSGRHHRARDGNRCTRRSAHGSTSSRCSTGYGRRGPRSRQSVGEDEQAALRPRHARHEDHRRRGQEGRALRHVRGRERAEEPQPYDALLLSVGRTPNGKKIGAEKAGVAVSDRGFIAVDNQMRTNVPHIYAIGDIVGQPMLAHKATHEGHVAAEAAAGEKSYFDARVIPSVAYTIRDRVGRHHRGRGEGQRRQGKQGALPVGRIGRAIANGRDEGFTKLLFDDATHRIVGGGIVGTHAGDLISEIALAIEMGADAVDIGRTIHPHPTLSESVGLAAGSVRGRLHRPPPPRKSDCSPVIRGTGSPIPTVGIHRPTGRKHEARSCCIAPQGACAASGRWRRVARRSTTQHCVQDNPRTTTIWRKCFPATWSVTLPIGGAAASTCARYDWYSNSVMYQKTTRTIGATVAVAAIAAAVHRRDAASSRMRSSLRQGISRQERPRRGDHRAQKCVAEESEPGRTAVPAGQALLDSGDPVAAEKELRKALELGYSYDRDRAVAGAPAGVAW